MIRVLISIVILILVAVGLKMFNFFLTADPSKNTYYAGCRILNSEFETVRLLSSARLCLPLADGSWIESDNKSYLKKMGPDGDQIWSKTGYYHHQFNLFSEFGLLTLRLVKKEFRQKKVLFDEIAIVDLNNGHDIKVLSIYDQIQQNDSNFNRFNADPYYNSLNAYDEQFGTNWVNAHLNSIQSFENYIVVNDLYQNSFVLDQNLNFQKFASFSEILKKRDLAVHDLQLLNKDTYLVFKNFFYYSDTESTFKIYMYQGDKIVFEFPIVEKDFHTSSFSGGVQKLQNSYLVGFPFKEKKVYKSVVGLISTDGQWIKKAVVDFRFQDIKLLPYANFLKLNKIK